MPDPLFDFLGNLLILNVAMISKLPFYKLLIATIYLFYDEQTFGLFLIFATTNIVLKKVCVCLLVHSVWISGYIPMGKTAVS